MPARRCPICGSDKYVRYGSRPFGRCAGCSAKERTRVVFACFEKLDLLRPGLSVLHVAPDRPLVKRFAETFGKGYAVADIRAAALTDIDDAVEKVVFDMTDLSPAMEKRRFDVILHSHVLEHVRASWQLAFLRMHGLLNPGGHHVFAVPILRDWSREDLGDMTTEKRIARFGQHDHMRYIGRRDFDQDMATIAKLAAAEFFRSAPEILSPAEMEALVGDRDVYVMKKF